MLVECFFTYFTKGALDGDHAVDADDRQLFRDSYFPNDIPISVRQSNQAIRGNFTQFRYVHVHVIIFNDFPTNTQRRQLYKKEINH